MDFRLFWRSVRVALFGLIGPIALLAVALAALLGSVGARAADFLEPEQAFKLRVETPSPKVLRVVVDIAPGYYLYRESLQFTSVDAELAAFELPKGKVKFDATFQKDVETYRNTFEVEIPVSRGASMLTLQTVIQGCADAGLCYPPLPATWQVSLRGFGGDGMARTQPEAGVDTATSVSGSGSSRIDLSAAAQPVPGILPAEPARSPEALLRSGSWWATLGAFWLMGLLLSFTPCVLPMLPILSSIIAGGGGASRTRSFALALSYSLGMAMVYTALGIAAGLAGEGLAAALQNPWVLSLFALMLATFSLSMFDVYELRLPVAVSNRLDGASRRLPGGKFAGVFLMGGLSALIVSPCVTAPLAGTLMFLSQTRDVVLAGAALFALAMGMSVPLLLLGASAGRWLPRSGAWMHAVKHFFGMLLLGVALWVVQPVLPPALAMAAWGLLLLVGGFMLRPFDANPHAAAPRVGLQRAAGLAALSLGVMQLIGAASGARDGLQPLAHFASARAAGDSVKAGGLAFNPVRSVAELEQAVAAAGRPVMLDFYADWCVSCKEMERYTFSDQAVQARLAGVLLLKADVTANSADDKALLKRFGLFGPPGTLFFGKDGQEIAAARLVGFESARDFEKTLQRAGL